MKINHSSIFIAWCAQEKVEKNRKKLESHILEILSATSSRNLLCVEENGFGKMLSARIEIPLCKYTGFAQGSGDRDYANGHEVVSSTNAKLPYIEKLPPYTTWIFLDKYVGFCISLLNFEYSSLSIYVTQYFSFNR